MQLFCTQNQPGVLSKLCHKFVFPSFCCKFLSGLVWTFLAGTFCIFVFLFFFCLFILCVKALMPHLCRHPSRLQPKLIQSRAMFLVQIPQHPKHCTENLNAANQQLHCPCRSGKKNKSNTWATRKMSGALTWPQNPLKYQRIWHALYRTFSSFLSLRMFLEKLPLVICLCSF